MAKVNDSTKEILQQLSQDELNGHKMTTEDRFGLIRKLYQENRPHTLEYMLPLLYAWHSTPLTLKDYQTMLPMFSTDRPKRTLWKCGRQVGKSLSLAASSCTISATMPNINTLIMTPLQEQVNRFSKNYVRELIRSSPFPEYFPGSRSAISSNQIRFPNGSNMIFSFASLSADRIRGINSDFINFDEIQDFDPDHLPIIEATATASRYEMYQYTGTPKSLDNTIHGLWLESSQAEWVIKCRHCGEWNIPSTEYHLIDMIGPWHEDISEETPGVICHKCKKPLYPRDGMWQHRYPDKRLDFSGYHVPQIVLPLHFASPSKWRSLVGKMNGEVGTTNAKFHNEILGESIDAGLKLVSVTDLQIAGSLPWSNNPSNPCDEIHHHINTGKVTVLAIDWGGGGEKLISFTTLALLTIQPDGTIECLWGKRLNGSGEHREEAQEVLHWFKYFKADYIVHDYTGAGALRETILVQTGYVSPSQIVPVEYVRSASHGLFAYIPANENHPRDHYRVDKTRSLLYTVQAIKSQLLRFFRYDGLLVSTDTATKEDKLHASMSLMKDFLALIEEKTLSSNGNDSYIISRSSLMSDDFAQAVNIGCLMLWVITGAFPNFATEHGTLQEVQYDTYWDDMSGV